MTDSFFFVQEEAVDKNHDLLKNLARLATTEKKQIFVVRYPLGDKKYVHEFDAAFIILSPKHPIMFCSLEGDSEEFEDYKEDIIEDLTAISDKYQYKEVLGRSRNWRKKLTETVYSENLTSYDDLTQAFEDNRERDPATLKRIELLISLLTGSINDINKVKSDVPTNLLDKIKQKIQLFDGEQTRFIYQPVESDLIRIQGLSGTGKTELLLHKLREVYVNKPKSKVLFTCHNRILAASLRQRIPAFFNFMKVEEQIEWHSRLWCVHAWGSASDPHSGAYRLICSHYDLTFRTYNRRLTFSDVCQMALEEIKERQLIASNGTLFDYVFLDESQDFPDSFIELCRIVTSQVIYVAGDIFQGIFDEDIISSITPDFLLSKCYRTDPKTLMFAHGLGMGLFEEQKLRWLSDDQWEACGYMVDRDPDAKSLLLKREPLRRFEELSGEVESTVMYRPDSNEQVGEMILEILKNITKQHETATPDDIGIIFTGGRSGFLLADELEYLVKKEFGWDVNKAYESKITEKNQLFISNKNNVKGLEFPFVICVSDKLTKLKHERNAIYMSMTRSFIQTHLILTNVPEDENLADIAGGLEYIQEHGCMKIQEPSESEQEQINTRIEYDDTNYSAHELAEMAFEELGIEDSMTQESMKPLILGVPQSKLNYKFVLELIRDYHARLYS